jgi:hypothetical protein
VALDEHAEDVFEGEVGLLDVHGDGGRDDDVVVAEVAHFAAAGAGEADGDEVLLSGLVEGVEDVGGVAGGGDGEEDVAGLAEGFDLAGEDLVVAEVVGAGGGMEESVVRAMARRAGRVLVRRTTNSATRCWASAAEPPLPATRSLWPDCMVVAVSWAMVTRVSEIFSSARTASRVAMDWASCFWTRCFMVLRVA